MGFCILMRDEDTDKPIPERFEVGDYYPKRVASLTEELALYESLPDAERRSLVVERQTKRLTEIEANRETDRKNNDYLGTLLAEIETWECPDCLTHMKEFMVQQVTQSICDYTPYYDREEAQIRDTTPADAARTYHEELIALLDRARKCLADEIQRVESNNGYLIALRESLR